MYGYWAPWYGFHWWWLIPIAMMILCFFMMRHGGCMPRRSGFRRDETAREILDRRYASGEIGKDEYEQKKRDIAQ